MDNTVKLPRTIVLATDTYRMCVGFFVAELWDEESFEKLAMQWLEHRDDPLTSDDLRWDRAAFRRLLRCPWWKRQQLVRETWDVGMQRRVSERLTVLQRTAGEHVEPGRWSRVPVRGLGWLATDEIEDANGPNAGDRELCAALVSTVCYCQWMAAGGSADLGRLIGLYEETTFASEA